LQELPDHELHKLRDVLRLPSGSEIAILPNDGTLVRCRFVGRQVEPLDTIILDTDAKAQVTIAQALPKGEKLDEVVRLCTEVGVARFLLFESERSVVNWDEKKRQTRSNRLDTIAREAAEVSGRGRLPLIEWSKSLEEVLDRHPEAIVLSEVEGIASHYREVILGVTDPVVVVGPEGGWTKPEIERIGDRAVTLGPRVLRVDTAAVCAAAIALLTAESGPQP
jgi:16S rRNA (uracil1498-N3)-methyltransferase